ncbi:hypothetical protein KCV87_20555 [Actinosynnema pretiosum subsp. pretiosum]|uniref:NYN domain-containing protein n=1 Tax=Actinosynnema pretiosum subsp. pretiosum TaxID=103721 RepID=A0AA45L2U5_9PSEU|nr:hypothetical protein KCV87_20555 [Actinosynnema pretiosum subsp. pretiosum]
MYGYNLYYGGRKRCGRGAVGWRWLDVRALFESVVAEQSSLWPGARIERLVYCTARISAAYNASGAQDQDVYLKALLAANSVDYIEYWNYINKVVTRPLAVEKGGGGKHRRTPVLVNPSGPIRIKVGDKPADDAVLLATVATFEEKGSDVNVASHLLVDMLTDAVDAAVVVTNDSDLRTPVREAWKRVPVGVVNPGGVTHAGALSRQSAAGLERARTGGAPSKRLITALTSCPFPQGATPRLRVGDRLRRLSRWTSRPARGYLSPMFTRSLVGRVSFCPHPPASPASGGDAAGTGECAAPARATPRAVADLTAPRWNYRALRSVEHDARLSRQTEVVGCRTFGT